MMNYEVKTEIIDGMSTDDFSDKLVDYMNEGYGMLTTDFTVNSGKLSGVLIMVKNKDNINIVLNEDKK